MNLPAYYEHLGAEAYRKGVQLEQCPFIGSNMEAASHWMHGFNMERDYWENEKPPKTKVDRRI